MTVTVWLLHSEALLKQWLLCSIRPHRRPCFLSRWTLNVRRCSLTLPPVFALHLCREVKFHWYEIRISKRCIKRVNFVGPRYARLCTHLRDSDGRSFIGADDGMLDVPRFGARCFFLLQVVRRVCAGKGIAERWSAFMSSQWCGAPATCALDLPGSRRVENFHFVCLSVTALVLVGVISTFVAESNDHVLDAAV